ncbi:MAG: hypothetical protein WAS75_09625, partial [Candidatus Microthrix subdominans]
MLVVATMVVGLAGIVEVGAQPVPYADTPVGGWAVNGRVMATEIIGNTVYVGGTFTSVSGPGGSVARQNLAAFDSRTGALRTGFVANANQAVRALDTNGTSLFVGGSFSSIAGVTRQRVASLNPTSGAVNAGFTANANGYVNALKVSGSRLYVGGTFSTLAGHSISRAGAVSLANGAAITSFAPRPNGTVHGLETTPDGSQVFVAGEFTSIAGVSRRYIAAVTPNGASTGPSYGSVVKYAVLQMAYDPHTGLLFAAVAGYGNQVAALNPLTGARPWHQYADGDVQAVAVDGDNVYFGFHEGFKGDSKVKMVAANTRTGAIVAGWKLHASSYMGVMSISTNGSTLVAGGELGWINGTNAGGMA